MVDAFGFSARYLCKGKKLTGSNPCSGYTFSDVGYYSIVTKLMTDGKTSN